MKRFIFTVEIIFCFVLLLPCMALANSHDSVSILNRKMLKLQNEINVIRQNQVSKKTDMPQNTKETALYFLNSPSDSQDLEPIILRLTRQDFKMDIFGQLNFMVFNADDGSDNYTFVASNSNYNSRLNINTVWHPESGRIKVGSNFRFAFPLNPSEEVSQEEQSLEEDIDTRKLEFYISDECLGTVFLGQGSTASDDSSEIDYSNTEIVGYSSVADVGGGLAVRDQMGSLISTPKIYGLYNNLDGFGRAVRIQYTTPDIHGLEISTSYSGESRGDLVFLYENHWRNVKIGGALSLTSTYHYFSGISSVRGNGVNGSASILFPIGISLTFAGGHINSKTIDRHDPSFWYGKLGYQNRFFDSGLTAMSIDYGNFKAMYDNNHEAKTYGAQLLQNVNLLSSSFYLGYRHYRPGYPFRNVNIVFAGIRYYV